jgi:allophanate hydrolase subunit 2
VPEGGAFDRSAHELANAMVGNGPEAASVELTLLGGNFRAEVPLAVALAGAPMPALLRRPDGTARRFTLPVAFAMATGDELCLGGAASGARTYLAVRGGWRSPIVLGSRSSERLIQAGEVLAAVPGWSPVRWPGPSEVQSIDPEAPIRLLDGPDVGLLADRSWHRHPFVVAGESDRMGLRLEGPEVEVMAEADRRSRPVAPGAVQVSGGTPIILGVACGTMGGYPHVSHVAAVDLGRLAQARPGQSIWFRPISLAEARRLDRIDREARLKIRLRIASLVGGGDGSRAGSPGNRPCPSGGDR